jgi:hypothetical protein
MTTLYVILFLRARSIPHTDNAILFHLPTTHNDRTIYNTIPHKALYPSLWQCYTFPSSHHTQWQQYIILSLTRRFNPHTDNAIHFHLTITQNVNTICNSITQSTFYPSYWQCYTFSPPYHTQWQNNIIPSLRRRSIPHTDNIVLFYLPTTHTDKTINNSIPQKAYYH